MITSLDNKTVKQLTKLHQKKYREDKFLLLDESIVRLAKDNAYLDTLVYCDKLPFAFDNTVEVSRDVLNKIAKTDGLNYLGVGKQIIENDEYDDRVIILDHLQDPLNIGRIMEAAYLFGFNNVVISEDSADIYNEKCIDNSKGAIFNLKICHKNILQEIDVLRDKGFKIYATGLTKQTKEMHEIKAQDKMAFILGNEGSGVSKDIMDKSDEIMKIDMVNIDSLNVGMAGSIIMYNFKK